MTKILMIGQAPNGTGDPGKPCTGRFMNRLLEVSGVSKLRYLRVFERVNLVPEFPGKNGKGDAFPMAEARRRAAEMSVAGRTVVLCGRKVADSFGVGAPLLGRAERGGAVFYVLPHPSGRNRWWNDPENRRRAGRLIRDLAEEAPET